MKPKKVLVAMSGGVDSSVAALLMKKKGYEVIGVFMKNWSDTKNSFGECSWKDDRKIAMQIAAKLNIPLITLDFEKQYRKYVVDEMFKLYKKGITPNPDVDCNNKVKFPLLWKAAEKLGANYIVTGHYSRIKKIKVKNKIVNKKNVNLKKPISSSRVVAGVAVDKNKQYQYQLMRAKDESKDQSYFLYRLTSKDLEHTLFPIGKYTKKQIREIAKKNNFSNYNRKSTVGICFIGKINLKKFLQKKIKPKKGNILDPDGNLIGQHDGIYYYTIGQKIGPKFGIDIKKPRERMKKWYVAKKNLKRNEIIAAPKNHSILYRKNIIMKDVHWINNNTKNKSVNKLKTSGRWSGMWRIKARIRQVGELLPAKLKKTKGKYNITLKKAITGVSEGQAIVLYKGEKCLGGGVISF